MIKVAKPASNEGKIVGATETAELKAYRNGPFEDVDMADGGLLPLQAPKTGQTLVLPKSGAFLGTLFNGTARAQIRVADGEVIKENDVWLLPVEASEIDGTGEFSGKLDIAGTRNQKNAVPVKLEVKDNVGWAVAAVLLGALLAFTTQLWLRRWRVRWSLWRRRKRLVTAYEVATVSFREHHPGFPDLKGPNRECINTYAHLIKDATKTYGDSTIYFDTSSDAYKKLEASLELAERDTRFLGARDDGLGTRLDGLRTAIESALRFVNQKYRFPRAPAFARQGAKILKTGQLEVGGAVKLGDKASAQTDYIKTWRKHAGLALRYEIWMRKLDGLPDGSEPEGMTPGDRHLLTVTGRRLAAAKEKLFDAADAAAFDESEAKEDLQEAYDRLADLGARHEIPLPQRERRTTDFTATFAQLSLQMRALLQSQVTHAFGSVGERIMGLTLRAAQPAKVTRLLRSFGDLLVLLFAILVGVLTALSTLYFGKNFGSPEDYLGVFLAGAASQLLVGGLADMLSQMRTVDHASATATAPAAARIETTSAG